MPQRVRASRQWQSFSIPISYKRNETRNRLLDACNVYSEQHRLETRHGFSRYNAVSLGGEVQSVSFFEGSTNGKSILAKVGTVLKDVAATGAHTNIKTGLTAAHKHRSRTFRDRCIITSENDGLFQYDGSTFSPLGQTPPSAPTVAIGTGALTDLTYQVALTFYSSTTGFETNIGASSSNIATTSDGIDVSAIPATATNKTIDKVRIYLKDVTNAGSFLYVTEINLGTLTYTIAANPTSTQTPPTTHGEPLSGGGKWLTEFNGSLVYTGNETYPNDVFMSEPNFPDAIDDTGTARTLFIDGNGSCNGIARGLYNQNILSQYLVITKKDSIVVYSNINGTPEQITISEEVGCISGDTVQVRNGDVFFMSPRGWMWIRNGRLVTDKTKNPMTLGNGDIDDIFSSPGYVYELNKSDAASFHSVYYPTLDQYLTFVSEGSSTDIKKAYVYEHGETEGFKCYSFPLNMNDSAIGRDSSDNYIVYLAGTNYIYTHSVQEDRTDIDQNGDDVEIPAFAIINWISGNDFDATYNYKAMILEGFAAENAIDVNFFTNYNLANLTEQSVEFPDPESGFILDESVLDEGFMTDGIILVPVRININRIGYNLAIGFYQTAENATMGLTKMQVDFSKNGNRNLP